MNNTTFTLANAQLLDSNWLETLPKTSFPNYVIDAKDELSDFKFIA